MYFNQTLFSLLCVFNTLADKNLALLSTEYHNRHRTLYFRLKRRSPSSLTNVEREWLKAQLSPPLMDFCKIMMYFVQLVMWSVVLIPFSYLQTYQGTNIENLLYVSNNIFLLFKWAIAGHFYKECQVLLANIIHVENERQA